jgi:hypothetical protein
LRLCFPHSFFLAYRIFVEVFMLLLLLLLLLLLRRL